MKEMVNSEEREFIRKRGLASLPSLKSSAEKAELAK